MSEIQNTDVQNDSVETDVTEERTYEDLSPYAAHFIVNLRLEEEKIDKEIKGPQMYNAAKNKAIVSNFHSRQTLANGKLEAVMLDGADFVRWLNAYVEKLQNGGSGRNADYVAMAKNYR
jgi:hypothetical protein